MHIHLFCQGRKDFTSFSKGRCYMRPVVYLLAVLLTSALFLISLRGVRADGGTRSQAETTVWPPELEYFKAINQAAPPKDPQLLFLLMAQYST